MRAPTPTAAAELAVPVRAKLIADLASLDGRLKGVTVRLAERRRNDLKAFTRALPSGDTIVGAARQKLDFFAAALRARARSAFDGRALIVERLSRRLSTQSPRVKTAAAYERARALGGRLERAGKRGTERFRDALARIFGADRAGRAMSLALHRRAGSGDSADETARGGILSQRARTGNRSRARSPWGAIAPCERSFARRGREDRIRRRRGQRDDRRRAAPPPRSAGPVDEQGSLGL